MWSVSTFNCPRKLRRYLMDNTIKPENCHITHNGNYFFLFWYI